MVQVQTVALVDDEVSWHHTISGWVSAIGAAVECFLDVASYLSGPTADLVLLDYRLADGTRAEDNVRALTSRGNVVVIVTSGASRTSLEACVRAGALGVAVKGEGPATLVNTISAVGQGSLDLNPTFARAAQRLHRGPAGGPEERLLQLLAMGVNSTSALERCDWTHHQFDRFLRRLRVDLERAVEGKNKATRGLRIGAVDDHPVTLDGLASRLELHFDEPLLFRAVSVDHLIQSGLEFDIIILDIILNDGHEPASNVLRLVKRGWPVVLFTSAEPRALPDIDAVCAALDAGAKALVTKGEDSVELSTAIEHALSGEVYVNSAWARARATRRSELSRLTGREREVLRCRNLGLTYKEIAERLFISEETVKSHIKSIGRKL